MYLVLVETVRWRVIMMYMAYRRPEIKHIMKCFAILCCVWGCLQVLYEYIASIDICSVTSVSQLQTMCILSRGQSPEFWPAVDQKRTAISPELRSQRTISVSHTCYKHYLITRSCHILNHATLSTEPPSSMLVFNIFVDLSFHTLSFSLEPHDRSTRFFFA
jgi:hypothetical protein